MQDEIINFLEERCNLLKGQQQKETLLEISKKYKEIEKTLSELLFSSSSSESALRIFGALSDFLWMTGRAKVAFELFVPQILKIEETETLPFAVSRKGLGSIFYALGRFSDSLSFYEKCIMLLKKRNQKDELGLLAKTLDMAGMTCRQMMKLDMANEYHQESLKIVFDEMDRALVLNNLGVVAMFGGNLEEAIEYHKSAMKLREKDARGKASSLNNLEICKRLKGEFLEAEELQLESLKIRVELGDLWGVAGSNVQLAMTLSRIKGREKQSNEYLQTARNSFQKLEDKLGLAECFEAEFMICKEKEFLVQADKLREEINAPRPFCFKEELEL